VKITGLSFREQAIEPRAGTTHALLISGINGQVQPHSQTNLHIRTRSRRIATAAQRSRVMDTRSGGGTAQATTTSGSARSLMAQYDPNPLCTMNHRRIHIRNMRQVRSPCPPQYITSFVLRSSGPPRSTNSSNGADKSASPRDLFVTTIPRNQGLRVNPYGLPAPPAKYQANYRKIGAAPHSTPSLLFSRMMRLL